MAMVQNIERKLTHFCLTLLVLVSAGLWLGFLVAWTVLEIQYTPAPTATPSWGSTEIRTRWCL